MSSPTLAELPLDEALRRRLAASAYRNLVGVRARLDLVSYGVEIVPGITAVDASGHSAGRLALEIASAGERLLFLADAVIHPISLEYPDTRTVGDHAPESMVATRAPLARGGPDALSRLRVTLSVPRSRTRGRERRPIGVGAAGLVSREST